MDKLPVSTGLRDEVLLDHLIAQQAFIPFSHMVEDLIVRHPIKRPEALLSDERAIIAKLGVHGLRVALESSLGNEDLVTVRSMPVQPADMMRYPESFVTEEAPGVVEWADALGEALLSEAYLCLGEDVETQIAAYRQATSAEEQYRVIEWLDARLKDMKEKVQRSDIDGDEMSYEFYHPIRLAPKFIDVYPHNPLSPTCLGLSIIAASFMNRASAPILHAGIMCTSQQYDATELSADAITKSLEFQDIAGGSTLFTEALQERGNAIYRSVLGNDYGYHAVTMTRLLDDTWAQIDPNYNKTQIIDSRQVSERFTACYDALETFSVVAPQLELGVLVPTPTPLEFWLKRYEPTADMVQDLIDRATTILTDSDDEALLTRLCEAIMLFDGDAIDMLEDGVQELVQFLKERLLCITADGDVEPVSDRTLLGWEVYAAIQKYVLHGDDVSVLKERCRADPSYLQHRLTDVLFLASTVNNLGAASMFAQANDLTRLEYSYELGRPSTRIGFAVAYEVASLIAEDPLPPTFWQSVWPSMIPVVDSPLAAKSTHQKEAALNMMRYAASKALRYTKDYGMIIKSMEIDERSSHGTTPEA